MSAPEAVPHPAQLTASQLVDLAWDYAENGDFWGAARCLRGASAKMEELARFRRLSIPPEQRP